MTDARIPAIVLPMLMKIRMLEKDVLSIHICMTEIPFPALRENLKWWKSKGEIDEFTDMLWNSLNEENKVSLFVRYIDIEDGTCETRIVNKNK